MRWIQEIQKALFGTPTEADLEKQRAEIRRLKKNLDMMEQLVASEENREELQEQLLESLKREKALLEDEINPPPKKRLKIVD